MIDFMKGENLDWTALHRMAWNSRKNMVDERKEMNIEVDMKGADKDDDDEDDEDDDDDDDDNETSEDDDDDDGSSEDGEEKMKKVEKGMFDDTDSDDDQDKKPKASSIKITKLFESSDDSENEAELPTVAAIKSKAGKPVTVQAPVPRKSATAATSQTRKVVADKPKASPKPSKPKNDSTSKAASAKKPAAKKPVAHSKPASASKKRPAESAGQPTARKLAKQAVTPGPKNRAAVATVSLAKDAPGAPPTADQDAPATNNGQDTVCEVTTPPIGATKITQDPAVTAAPSPATKKATQKKSHPPPREGSRKSPRAAEKLKQQEMAKMAGASGEKVNIIESQVNLFETQALEPVNKVTTPTPKIAEKQQQEEMAKMAGARGEKVNLLETQVNTLETQAQEPVNKVSTPTPKIAEKQQQEEMAKMAGARGEKVNLLETQVNTLETQAQEPVNKVSTPTPKIVPNTKVNLSEFRTPDAAAQMNNDDDSLRSETESEFETRCRKEREDSKKSGKRTYTSSRRQTRAIKLRTREMERKATHCDTEKVRKDSRDM